MQLGCVIDHQANVVLADRLFSQRFLSGNQTPVSKQQLPDSLRRTLESVIQGQQESQQRTAFINHHRYVVSALAYYSNNQTHYKVDFLEHSEQPTLAFLQETELDANIGAWELDLLNNQLLWSPLVFSIYGKKDDTPLSVTVGLANYSAESQARIEAYLENARNGQAFSDEFDFYDVTGQYKRVIATGRPVRDAQGKVCAIRGTLQDITDKYFERERNRLALSGANVGVWEMQHQADRVIWSPEMGQIFEFDDISALTFEDWVNALHPDDRNSAVELYEKSLESDEYYKHVFRIVGRRTGIIKFIRVIARHYRNSNGEVFRTIGINFDTSESYRRQQEQLIERSRTMQQAKFIALGEMAAGIGHEVNNPLSILAGNIELLEASFPESLRSQEMSRQLENIHTCINRIQNITNGLRRLVRDDSLESYQSLDMYALLDSTILLMKEIYLKEGIQLTLEATPPLWVKGHFSEIQQVFMNLINNAKDAVETTAQKIIIVEAAMQEDDIEVSVTDTGIGISQQALERIFNSPYTEKPSGRGTGLGLGLCKRIVEEHKGSITVRSTLAKGSTLTVRLPKSKDFAEELPDASETQQKVSSTHSVKTKSDYPSKEVGKNARVVVIDDEQMILSVVEAFFTRNKIDCFCTTSVLDALDEISTGSYDLVLSDICMPELDAENLLNELVQRQYSIPVILMTGGVMDDELMNKFSSSITDYLYKPFNEKVLIGKVHKVLSE